MPSFGRGGVVGAFSCACLVGCLSSSSPTTPGDDAGPGAGTDSSVPGDSGGAGDSSAATDASSTASAFVGSWSRTGTDVVICPLKTSTLAITGTSVIVLGATSGTLVETLPTGCVLNYTVSGNVASAAPGEPCSVTVAGVASVVTTITHTLTLSPSGTTLVEASTDDDAVTLADGGTEACQDQSSGTFTKT